MHDDIDAPDYSTLDKLFALLLGAMSDNEALSALSVMKNRMKAMNIGTHAVKLYDSEYYIGEAGAANRALRKADQTISELRGEIRELSEKMSHMIPRRVPSGVPTPSGFFVKRNTVEQVAEVLTQAGFEGVTLDQLRATDPENGNAMCKRMGDFVRQGRATKSGDRFYLVDFAPAEADSEVEQNAIVPFPIFEAAARKGTGLINSRGWMDEFSHQTGFSLSDISKWKAQQVVPFAVLRRCARLTPLLKQRPPHKWTSEEDDFLVDLRNSGNRNLVELAAKLSYRFAPVQFRSGMVSGRLAKMMNQGRIHDIQIAA